MQFVSAVTTVAIVVNRVQCILGTCFNPSKFPRVNFLTVNSHWLARLHLTIFHGANYIVARICPFKLIKFKMSISNHFRIVFFSPSSFA